MNEKQVSATYNRTESVMHFNACEGDNHRDKRLRKELEVVKSYLLRQNVEGLEALDIGCSGGRYIRMMEELGIKVYGIDTSEIAIESARKHTNADVQVASVTNIPFPYERFDIVLCIELLHHFDEITSNEIIINLARLLRPRGKLVLDVRNCFNPVLWYSYKRRDGVHFPLKTHNIFSTMSLLKKHGLEMSIQGLYFPIPYLAPYIMVFAEKK